MRDRSETDRDKQTETDTHRGWPHRGPGVCEICVRDKRLRVRLSKWEKGGGGEGADVSNTVLGVRDIVKRTCLIVWAGPLFVFLCSVDIIFFFFLFESSGGRWCFSCCSPPSFPLFLFSS